MKARRDHAETSGEGSEVAPTVRVTSSAGPRQRLGLRESLRAGVRVAVAVLVLLATATDAWLTALLGLPPLIPALRHLTRMLADELRRRAAGAIDAEIINDPERKVWR